LPIASPPSPGRENIPRKTDGEREILNNFYCHPGGFYAIKGKPQPLKESCSGIFPEAGPMGLEYNIKILKGGMGQGVPIFQMLAMVVGDR
jgi:hypothetical protein